VGIVYQVDGSYVGVAFSSGSKLPKAHFGETLGRGEVGEFLVVDVGGIGAFGRIISIETTASNADLLVHSRTDRRIPVQGRLQLLSTLRLSGEGIRGIAKYPRVGDPVFAASAEVISAILEGSMSDTVESINLGRLSVDESVTVSVPMARLFGRHLAIVGATGSGKSWTLGHLAESVASKNGKFILIDATGEYHTLGSLGTHMALGSIDGEPLGTVLSGIPHFAMRESDRHAFLNPSAGAQLPKLREAVRSLKLANAISNDPSAEAAHLAMLTTSGALEKASRKVANYQSALTKYGTDVEGVHSPFDIKLLAEQVQNECIWPPRAGETSFGGVNSNDLGYLSTLVSRVTDLLQLQEVMRVIDPRSGIENVVELIDEWMAKPDQPLLRISLRNLTFTNHLREIVVNVLGQALLGWAREGRFKNVPLVVALDEAHQFFDVTVGDEFSSTRLNAFDSIAKEGRKYGLTVCMVTQRPGDLPAGVLSQVGMTIVHRLADGRDRQRIEQAAAELDHSATRLLPGLIPGEAILMGVDFPVPVSVKMQRPVHPPESEGPKYQNWGATNPNEIGQASA
jgi:energy-coupling factor transporter ATP-binding protein EcfA2